MGQLFLWTQKIDEALEEEFKGRFGFAVPEPMFEITENLPGEFTRFLGLYSIEEIVSEEYRPPVMMPGLVPFGSCPEGDLYCFQLPWKEPTGQVAFGIWMHETGHFLPISCDMRAFLAFWLGRQVLDHLGGEDWDEMRKILEVFQDSAGLESCDLLLSPPVSDVAWHSEVLQYDELAPFSLSLMAVRQMAASGFAAAQSQLRRAGQAMRGFGAPSIWNARLAAMRGRGEEARRYYWKHLCRPMFANGYHYFWEAGDLMIPENSEAEAVEFLTASPIPADDEIMDMPKLEFLRSLDGTDNSEGRLQLAGLLEKRGDREAALTEFENAFFLKAWDEDEAKRILKTLLCIYPEHDRFREAEQCRRAIAKLEQPPMPIGG